MSKKKKKSPTPAKYRNPLAYAAGELQRCAGGIHKDKRSKRKNRKSWEKEYLQDI